MGTFTAVLISAAIVALTIVYGAWLSKQDSYFPGPAPRFLAGNIHQIPMLESWKVFARWSKDYGPVFLLHAFGQNIIILNSHTTVMDMLELRSSNYSGRPVLWIYKQVLGQDLDVFTAPSSHSRFQAYRKLLHTALNPKAVRSYRSLQEREAQILLRSLHYQPEAFVNHFRRNAGAVILEIAYGWTVNHDSDYLVNLMEESFKINAEIISSSSWLVTVLPILRFIPSWILGCTSFERTAQKYKKQLERCFHIPHEWAKEQIQSGMYIESFTSRNIQPEHILGPELEDLIKMCSTALYAGGADTTVAAMTTFFLTMTLNLDVQLIAQEEIDRVIGHERLPTTQDQSKLPYVEALIKEVLRWAPVGPLGLPHSALKCDSYQGYTIPAGSTVIANIWALMHDPAVYPDPFKFKPARFLSDGAFEAQYDPRHYVFGFGRRVCPGAHLANASLFLNIASVLAAFSILKPLDDDGKEFDPPVEYTSGVIMHPKPFPCRIIARAHALHLLQLED